MNTSLVRWVCLSLHEQILFRASTIFHFVFYFFSQRSPGLWARRSDLRDFLPSARSDLRMCMEISWREHKVFQDWFFDWISSRPSKCSAYLIHRQFLVWLSAFSRRRHHTLLWFTESSVLTKLLWSTKCVICLHDLTPACWLNINYHDQQICELLTYLNSASWLNINFHDQQMARYAYMFKRQPLQWILFLMINKWRDKRICFNTSLLTEY